MIADKSPPFCYSCCNMRRLKFPFLICAAVCCAITPASAQKFQPKTIQFNGDPDYSTQELLAAANLKAGAVFTSAEMNDHSKLLMDSGVFENLTYKFDGVDLVFNLTPAAMLYPVRLENLPLTAGPDLDAKLHQRFPLYHGKVPADGTLLGNVRTALEDLLAAQGIKASVATTPFGAAGTRNVSAMNFAIVTPLVRIGALQLQGVSPEMMARVKPIADKSVGTPYDTMNSAASLEHAFSSFYADDGYASVHVHAVRAGDPVISASAVGIPFAVTVDEGRLYKLGSILLPPDSLVTTADIQKFAFEQAHAPKMTPIRLTPDQAGSAAAGGSITGAQAPAAAGLNARSVWQFISSRYHSKGYIDFAMTPHPEFDEAAGTVNYTVELNPGPVYHLALLKFDNVSDDLRKLLMRNWQMFPGDPFDESYVASFILKAQTSDPILQRTLTGVKVSCDVRADPATHDVNLIIRLERR